MYANGMTKTAKKHGTGCLVAYALDTFGDRWSLLIVRDMILYGHKRYGDFLCADEKIATNILADRLKRLVADGIVHKTRDPENGRSFVYMLTPKGLALIPAILEIIRWSGQFAPINERRRKLLDRINNDRDGFISEIYAREGVPFP